MLLSPSKPLSPLITKVILSEEPEAIYLVFPEKNDTFREAVKNRGFRWSFGQSRWEKEIYSVTGPLLDRAAETAHVLLAAGFFVEVDDNVAQIVIDVSYEPEKRLRVSRVVEGDYTDWFAIVWPRDDDYYRQAKRISGSRYAPPYVVLPPDRYEAVLDFADQYNFYITPAAQEGIDEAIERKRAALIIDAPLKTAEQPARPKFDMEAGIDPELVDDDEPI